MRPLATTNIRLLKFAASLAILCAVNLSTATRADDGLGAAKPAAAAGTVEPKFKISRETTFFLGPLDADGYVDYAAALDERIRGKTTNDDNALPGIWSAYGAYGSHDLPPPEYFQALGIAPPKPVGDYLIPEQVYLEAYDVLLHEEIWNGFSAAEQRIWTAREFPVVFAWLKRNEAALDRAVEATKKPRFYRPIIRKSSDDDFIVALMPHEMVTLRGLSRHLALRAHYRMGEGRFTDAWNDLLAHRRLARLIATSPTLLDVLLAYSIDGDARRAERSFLEANRLNQSELRRCLRELKELPPLASQADAIDLGERAFLLDSIQELSRGNYQMLSAQEGPLTDLNRRHIARNDFTQAMRTANHRYDRIAAALRLPNAAARVAALDALEDERKRLEDKFRKRPGAGDRSIDRMRDGELIDFLLSSDSLLTPLRYRSHDKHEQGFALSKLGLALAAFRAEHGRFPARLDDLRPQYFTAVPGDLYSGNALRYRVEPDGYLLYSVGANGRDDGGADFERSDVGNTTDETTDDLRLRISCEAN